MNKEFKSISLEKAQRIPDIGGHYTLWKNNYWAVDDKGDLLFYGTSPQCNRNKIIVDSIVKSNNHPGVKAVFVENVFVPLNINDYI